MASIAQQGRLICSILTGPFRWQDSGSEFDDGYDDDLMGDEKDRARLAGLTELDREMELAERAEKRDEMLERRQTARVLRQQQQTAAKVRCLSSSPRAPQLDQSGDCLAMQTAGLLFSSL